LLQLAALFQDHVAEAQQWVDRAVALPGGDPDSLNNRAGIFWSLNNYPQLAATLEQSLAQRTTAVACHYKLMLLVWGWGDLPAGREWVEQMPGALLQEDRVAMLAFLTWYWSRQPDRALEVLQRFPRPFIEQGALFVSTDYLAGCAQLLAGHPEAAQLAFATGLKAINERAAQDPSNRRVLFEKTRLLARLGQRPEAAHSLRVLQELAGAEATSASYAELLVLTGSNAEAMAVAERGIDRRRSRWPVAVNHLRNDPVFDPLRPDPRFQALIAKGEAQLAELRASGGPAAAVTPAPDAKSVAVLAFANLSDDKANEYFSDGISEELLTVLQKIPGLHVAARTSAFSFKGKSATAREIGQKLGVANLVEGSVQKSGSRVKVTARLSRVSTGEEQWSQSYTRELKDVFALQEELALAIVGELRGQLAGGDDAAAVKAAVKGGTTNAEAHQQYLQGRYFMNRFSVENMLRAISCFEQATALDPNFALAWAALARTHALHVGWADKLTRQEFDAELAQARRAADRALALEADLPEALSARFEIQFNYDFDWKAGAETMRRGLALAPSDPIMLGAASRVASIFGDRARALDLARQAVALDPVNSEIRVYLGLALLQVRQLPEARAEFARVAELNPTTPWAYAGSGLAYLYEGKYAEALTAAKPEATNFAGMLVAAIALQGQKKMAEADAALAQLIKEDADVGAYQIAEVYGFRGDKDQAFAWLDRAHRQRDAGLAVFNNDPFLDSVRSDPRWAAFQREMGLAEDQLK
jgi:TolB-like protein